MEFEVNDYELLYLIRQNCEESVDILIRRYTRTIWSIIHRIVLPPAPPEVDLQDVFQEAVLGLMHAVHHFDESRNVYFVSYARVCIEHAIRSLMRRYSAKSYRVLSQSLSLDMQISEDDNLVLMDTIATDSKDYNPVYCSYVSWARHQIPKIKESLPEHQWDIFQDHCEGYTYREMARKYHLSEKDIDNILQKIKRKVRVMFDT